MHSRRRLFASSSCAIMAKEGGRGIDCERNIFLILSQLFRVFVCVRPQCLKAKRKVLLLSSVPFSSAFGVKNPQFLNRRQCVIFKKLMLHLQRPALNVEERPRLCSHIVTSNSFGCLQQFSSIGIRWAQWRWLETHFRKYPESCKSFSKVELHIFFPQIHNLSHYNIFYFPFLFCTLAILSKRGLYF